MPLGRYYGGAIFSPPDSRDYLFDVALMAPNPNTDLSALLSPVKDQGQESSCTGFSGTVAFEGLMRRDGADPAPLSPAFMYYETRIEDGSFPQDAGGTMRGACASLADYGCCWEAEWPYVAGDVGRGSTAAQRASAAQQKIVAYYRIPGTGAALLQGILQALNAGYLVYFAFNVYASFERTGASGRVPMPTPGEPVLGGHAGLCYGSSADQSYAGGIALWAQNSWGTGWGNTGRYTLPADYVNQGIVVEAWVLQTEGAPSPPPVNDWKAQMKEKTQSVRDLVAQAQADRCAFGAAKAVYQASMVQIMDHDIGPIVDLMDQLDALIDAEPSPPPPPPPPPGFAAPLGPGAIYGQTKWLPGSLGCDLFVPRGTPVYAPMDCVVEEVLGGDGLHGGDEFIFSTKDRQLAFRYRHCVAVGRVGDNVARGAIIGHVNDPSLDQLGRLPHWAVGFPDGWQHLDLSVAKGTDQFSSQGGGGGNVSAYDWLQSIGYVGVVWTRTPGPPDANT